jgi:group I intron endonuclease
MDSGIYIIENLVNNKIYVGSTNNLDGRKGRHFSSLRKNKHHNKHLQFSFNKYKEDNFKFYVLEECKIKNLANREQYYIDKLKPQYNKRLIAENNQGLKHSEEAKRKISIAHKGNTHNLGRKQSKESVVKREKVVLQLTKNGEFIKEWKSLSEIERELNFNKGNISNCCKGKKLTAYKYKWQFKNN